jgi:hypothetical protein
VRGQANHGEFFLSKCARRDFCGFPDVKTIPVFGAGSILTLIDLTLDLESGPEGIFPGTGEDALGHSCAAGGD